MQTKLISTLNNKAIKELLEMPAENAAKDLKEQKDDYVINVFHKILAPINKLLHQGTPEDAKHILAKMDKELKKLFHHTAEIFYHIGNIRCAYLIIYAKEHHDDMRIWPVLWDRIHHLRRNPHKVIKGSDPAM